MIALPTPTLTATIAHASLAGSGTFSVGVVRVVYDRARDPAPPATVATPPAHPGRGNYVRIVKPTPPRHLKVDMTGQVFGRWTVLGDAPHKPRHRRLRCRCVCGFVADVLAYDLRRGASKGCHSCNHNSPEAIAIKRASAQRRHDEQRARGARGRWLSTSAGAPA